MEIRSQIIFFTSCLIFLVASAQTVVTYTPISEKEQSEIENMLNSEKIQTFKNDQSIAMGCLDLAKVLNMASYNPIEGARLRLMIRTNNKFSKRLQLQAMGAYGTKDTDFKYFLGASYNFSRKAQGAFAFPASTLSFSYGYDTYVPFSKNFDIFIAAIGSWDKSYFGKKKEARADFLQEFDNGTAIRPFVNYRHIVSYLYYDDGAKISKLDPGHNLEDYSCGLTLSYTLPAFRTQEKSVLSGRLYDFPSTISLTWCFDHQQYVQDNNFHYLDASIQHRFRLPFNMSLDCRVSAAKLFGTAFLYTRLSPDYNTLSKLSNPFGFNLYKSKFSFYKEYLQFYMQYNLGGMLLDKIKFFRSFRPNEFINFKGFFTNKDEPYMEAGIGLDQIFTIFGVELIKSFCAQKNELMSEWGIRIRCKL